MKDGVFEEAGDALKLQAILRIFKIVGGTGMSAGSLPHG